jgi:uncharacterized protein YqeY
MALIDKINEDIKQAMLAKEKEKLEAIRAIKAALILAQTEKGSTHEITPEAEIKLLQKLVKQRKESAEIYKSQNRDDLAEKELFEASIIEKYLPAQLSLAEIENIIKEVIKKVGASSQTDFGKVMGAATKELAGKADGKVISEIVKKLLAS